MQELPSQHAARRSSARAHMLAQALDALSIAAMFRKSGDPDAARLFVAMSMGYMRAARNNGRDGCSSPQSPS